MSAFQLMEKLGQQMSRRQFLKNVMRTAFGLLLGLVGTQPQRAQALSCTGSEPCQPYTCSGCSGVHTNHCCCLAWPRTCSYSEAVNCQTPYWCWICQESANVYYWCLEYDSSRCSYALYYGPPAPQP